MAAAAAAASHDSTTCPWLGKLQYIGGEVETAQQWADYEVELTAILGLQGGRNAIVVRACPSPHAAAAAGARNVFCAACAPERGCGQTRPATRMKCHERITRRSWPLLNSTRPCALQDCHSQHACDACARRLQLTRGKLACCSVRVLDQHHEVLH